MLIRPNSQVLVKPKISQSNAQTHRKPKPVHHYCAHAVCWRYRTTTVVKYARGLRIGEAIVARYISLLVHHSWRPWHVFSVLIYEDIQHMRRVFRRRRLPGYFWDSGVDGGWNVALGVTLGFLVGPFADVSEISVGIHFEPYRLWREDRRWSKKTMCYLVKQ